MAITPEAAKPAQALETPQSKKQKKMAYLLMLAILLTAAVLYFGFFKKTVVEETPSPTSSVISSNRAEVQIEQLKNVDLNLPIFTDRKFLSLILNGEFPIAVGQQGRPDPFSPF